MFVYSHILSTFLTGFVFLVQISFNQASGAKPKPSASVQVTQTFILPFYLKSKPLSEKKLVFRKALSFFPFSEKNPSQIREKSNGDAPQNSQRFFAEFISCSLIFGGK